MLAATRATVLIVEDDPSLRHLYRAALQSAGYVVVAVDDGIAALNRIESDVPSAVVLDLALPRLNGRDVHRELASRPSTCRIPIVVVSGTDTSDLNPSEFACVLHKPIHPEAIVFAVENCLRRQHRSAEFT